MFAEFMNFIRNDGPPGGHVLLSSKVRVPWDQENPGTRTLKEGACPLSEDSPYEYTPPEPFRADLQSTERAFARLFSTQDGRQVLGYLQAITFQRALGPTSTDDQLRHMEGQRSMMAAILRLIDRGRKQR